MIEKWRHALDKGKNVGTMLVYGYIWIYSFNIFINDFFCFIQDACICNFAYDNLLYSIGNNFKEVNTILKRTLSSYKYGFMRIIWS